MNLLHRWCCSSSSWKQIVEKFIVPWVLDGIDLGSQSLEIGPGYGATTDVLCARAEHLTCVEIDKRLAQRLRRRNQNQNMKVVCQNATLVDFAPGSFDSAVCFTMLHHVPSASSQDRVLKQVARVLRPEGIFAGTDGLDSKWFRDLHIFDTLVVVPPGTFGERLRAAGFTDVTVETNPYAFRFRARKSLH
jgi:SAM-dependent methyltransferase